MMGKLLSHRSSRPAALAEAESPADSARPLVSFNLTCGKAASSSPGKSPGGSSSSAGSSRSPSIPEGSVSSMVQALPRQASSSKVGGFAHRLSTEQTKSLQLANELQLVRALNEELLEDERRSEPLEPTATDHASLAIRHSCEALARGWLNGQQLLWALCFASCDGSARGPSTPLRPGSTSARSGSPGSFLSRSPAHPPSPTNRLLEEQLAPSSGASVLGEEGVIEVHLPRKLKRSNTQRLSTIDQAEKANAEAQAHEHAKLFMVPEDKPEVVAIAGFWCAAHASKQAWDLSMLTLILYSCVIIPFRIGMAAPAEGFGKTVSSEERPTRAISSGCRDTRRAQPTVLLSVRSCGRPKPEWPSPAPHTAADGGRPSSCPPLLLTPCASVKLCF